MKNIFRLNSPLMSFLGRIGDLIILSLLWVICSIPIITIGPATTALYYVTLKMAKNEEDKIIKSFFYSFKQNFKQGSIFTLIFIAAFVALYLNYRITVSTEGVFGNILFVLCLIFSICVLGAALYTFPLLAKFYNSVGRTFKNAVLLSLQNLFSTILLLVLNCLPIVALLISTKWISAILPIWIILAPGGIAYLCSLRISKIFEPLIHSS